MSPTPAVARTAPTIKAFAFRTIAAAALLTLAGCGSGGAGGSAHVASNGFGGTTWSEKGGQADIFERVYFDPDGEVRTQVYFGGHELPAEDQWGDSTVWGSWREEASTIYLHHPGTSDTTDSDGDCDSALTVDGDQLVRVKGSGECMLGLSRTYFYDPAPESLDSLVGH